MKTMPVKRNLNDAGKADLYRQYQAMAHKLAAQFSRMFHTHLQDMTDEAMSALGRVVAQWNDTGTRGFKPWKASATSHIHRQIYWDLLTFCQRKQQKAIMFSALDREELKYETSRPASWVETMLRDLGDDARELVRIILFAPAEIAEAMSPASPAKARRAVRGFMEGIGWNTERLETAWGEVAAAL